MGAPESRRERKSPAGSGARVSFRRKSSFCLADSRCSVLPDFRARVSRSPSGLIHSDNSQIGRSSSSSLYESRYCRDCHPNGSPSTRGDRRGPQRAAEACMARPHHGDGRGLRYRWIRLMASCRSTTDWKTPRLRRWRVSLAKKPSTALSQDAEVGVKWKVQRG